MTLTSLNLMTCILSFTLSSYFCSYISLHDTSSSHSKNFFKFISTLNHSSYDDRVQKSLIHKYPDKHSVFQLAPFSSHRHPVTQWTSLSGSGSHFNSSGSTSLLNVSGVLNFSSNTPAVCRDVHNKNQSDKCSFVQHTTGCLVFPPNGYINYTTFIYCTFSPRLLPFAVTILFVWLLFLFSALAIVADDFFCPALVVIAKTMRLSDNIAGVTFLAFGNGAPDVFSAIAAVGSMKGGDAGLAFGALLGAGVFITTFIAGSVSFIKPFHTMQRPFFRDVIFYTGSVFWAYYILNDGLITVYESIGFLILYFVYVVVVVVGRLVYERQKRSRGIQTQNIQNVTSIDSSNQSQSINSPEDLLSSENDLQSPLNTDPELQINKEEDDSHLLSCASSSNPVKDFLQAINPLDGWKEARFYKKIFIIFKMPAQLIFLLTIPVVDLKSEPKHNWNRHLNSFHFILAPLVGLIIARANVAFMLINGVFPVWAVMLLIGVALSALIFFTSCNDTQPKYHWVFGYLGFIVAVIWIQTVANEVVNILQSFGIVFNIADAILGLTLLAWANSISDFIADTTMARQGYPRIGISACYGGPMFNLLLGVGIPFTIACLKKGHPIMFMLQFPEF